MPTEIGENLEMEWSQDPLSPQVWDAISIAASEPARCLDELLKLGENGSPIAMIYLASAYIKGKYGANVDESEGEYWLRKAEKEGSIEARFQLARRYLRSGDVKMAEELYLSLADCYTPAQYILGLNYLNGRYFQRDPVKAEIFLKKAATNGHLLARKTIARNMLRKPHKVFIFLKGLFLSASAFSELVYILKNNPRADRIRQ